MAIHTRRWEDPAAPGEPESSLRVLVCRYRPRALKKEFETWDVWYPELGPSIALHAAAYGRGGLKISWEIYRRRYLREMKGPEASARMKELAARIARGESITLLCSSACERESRCHRSLLAELIVAALPESAGSVGDSPSAGPEPQRKDGRHE
jgi:uncharacterized protein YeaO (DUF488 family)